VERPSISSDRSRWSVSARERVQFAGSNGNDGNSGNTENIKMRTESRSSKRIISATAYYRDSDGNIQTEKEHMFVNKPQDFGIINGPIVRIGAKGTTGVYKMPDDLGNKNFVYKST